MPFLYYPTRFEEIIEDTVREMNGGLEGTASNKRIIFFSNRARCQNHQIGVFRKIYCGSFRYGANAEEDHPNLDEKKTYIELGDYSRTYPDMDSINFGKFEDEEGLPEKNPRMLSEVLLSQYINDDRLFFETLELGGEFAQTIVDIYVHEKDENCYHYEIGHAHGAEDSAVRRNIPRELLKASSDPGGASNHPYDEKELRKTVESFLGLYYKAALNYNEGD